MSKRYSCLIEHSAKYYSAYVATIAHMTALPGFAYNPDPTYNTVPVLAWSAIETSASFVCACLPAIRQAALCVFPKMWATVLGISRRSTNATGRSSHANDCAGNPGLDDSLARDKPVMMKKLKPIRGSLSNTIDTLNSFHKAKGCSVTPGREARSSITGSATTLITTGGASSPDLEKTTTPSLPRAALPDLQVTAPRKEYSKMEHQANIKR